MKKISLNTMHLLGALFLVMFMLAACATVPGTGRSQLSLVDNDEMNKASAAVYSKMIKDAPLSRDKKNTALLKKVGVRISKAAEEFLRMHDMADEVAKYRWEFNLIESSEVNAFCMAGGKVAFYTGILPICQGEDGIATIMGHEVAHAIARHGAERASQGGLVDVIGGLASVGLAVGGVDSGTSNMIMSAYGVGSNVGVLLPFSRTHESEADRIGLSLMAMAGYDPKVAVNFWQRMADYSAKQGGKGGPEFLSTHPSDAKRIKNIKEYLPEAEARYVPRTSGRKK